MSRLLVVSIALLGWSSSVFAANFVDDPALYGALEVTLRCVESTNVACQSQDDKMMNMIIVNPGSLGGLVVSFNTTDFGNQIYGFNNMRFSNDVRSLEGETNVAFHAEFRIYFNETFDQVTGWINDLDSGKNFNVSGRRVVSLAPLYRNSPPEPASWSQLEATPMNGYSNGQSTQISIKRSIQGSTAGQRVAIAKFNGGIAQLSFSGVVLDETSGTLTLTHKDGPTAFIQWVLAYRADRNGRRQWSGYGLSSGVGMAFPVAFAIP